MRHFPNNIVGKQVALRPVSAEERKDYAHQTVLPRLKPTSSAPSQLRLSPRLPQPLCLRFRPTLPRTHAPPCVTFRPHAAWSLPAPHSPSAMPRRATTAAGGRRVSSLSFACASSRGWRSCSPTGWWASPFGGPAMMGWGSRSFSVLLAARFAARMQNSAHTSTQH